MSLAHVGRMAHLRVFRNRKQLGTFSNLLGPSKLTDIEKDNEVGNQVNLHDLYVKEAITYAEKAIEKAREQGISEIRLIIGMSTPTTLDLDN